MTTAPITPAAPAPATIPMVEHEQIKTDLLAQISALTEQNNTLTSENVKLLQDYIRAQHERNAALDSYDKMVKEHHGVKTDLFAVSHSLAVQNGEVQRLQKQKQDAENAALAAQKALGDHIRAHMAATASPAPQPMPGSAPAQGK